MADKEKDPAFLFYPLDWLQGTASLFPIEKGVYIDLLCHQHQDGSLPNDPERLARMVGLPVDQFATIWSTIRCKFVDRPGNRLVNLRLEKETTKRSTGSHKNAIVGRLAVLVRTTKGVPKVIIESIKKEFNIAHYEHLSIKEATDRLTEWWTDRLTKYLNNGIPIPIENENENKDKDRLEEEEGGMGGGEGEREGEPMFSGDPPNTGPPDAFWREGPPWPEHASQLPAQMVEIFVAQFPEYPRQDGKDFSACLEIAYQIADQHGWPRQSVLNGHQEDVLGKWKDIVTWMPDSTWFKTKPIPFLNTNYQALIQEKSYGTPKKFTPNKGYSGRGPTNGLSATSIEIHGAGNL